MPNWSSNPSFVSPLGVSMTPAFRISMSMWSSASSTSLLNPLIESPEAKSSLLKKTCSLPVILCISATASAPFAPSRQAIMTRPPLAASSIAVSLPMPVLPPVMTTVLPSILTLLGHCLPLMRKTLMR